MPCCSDTWNRGQWPQTGSDEASRQSVRWRKGWEDATGPERTTTILHYKWLVPKSFSFRFFFPSFILIRQRAAFWYNNVVCLYYGDVLTVLVILASNGTIPSSVRICRFILSFAILVMTAQTLASNSLFVDFSKLRISPSSPMRERTVSPASCNQKIVSLGLGRCLHKCVPVGTNKGIFFNFLDLYPT